MSLFAELKRRNVFRVGVAYAITTWLLALLGSPYLFEYFSGVECPVTGQLNWSPAFAAERGGEAFFELMRRSGSVGYWRDYGWPDDCASLEPSLAECAR